MRKHIKKLIRTLVGIGFLILGTIGLFTPLIQGILFILIGIAILEGKPIKEYFKKIWQKRKSRT